MFFSKTFGYALRSILYIASEGHQRQRIQVDEIARNIRVPKHFLSKVLKAVVKNGMLQSTKGPYGGFSINEKTLSTKLITLVMATDTGTEFKKCSLLPGACNATNPCPLHHKIEAQRKDLRLLLTKTTIGDLLNADNPDFLKSITTSAISD